MYFSYITEYEDDGGTRTREWGASLVAARGYARRSSANHPDRIVYVVAIEERMHDCERVGAEGYAHGLRDSVNGRMAAWRNGAPVVTETQIDRIKEILLAHYDPEEAFAWLTTNNKQLGGFSPLHMLASGHGSSVLAVLECLDAGVYL